MWKMIGETNAIEAMAVSIRFSEPVSNMLAKKMQNSLDAATRELGILDRRPMQGFQINIANPGEVRPINGLAMSYQQTSLVRNFDGIVEQKIIRQVEMQQTHLTYQTWRYGHWSDELRQMIDVLAPAMQIAAQGAAFGSLRLEYLDRFLYEGDASEPPIADLLSESSNWLAPHVFQSAELWHSHTGKFTEVTDAQRRLVLVNADYQDLTGPDPRFAGRRAIQLVTAAEDQFTDLGLEVSSEDIQTFLSSRLHDLHGIAIELFKQVVRAEFREENGLPH